MADRPKWGITPMHDSLLEVDKELQQRLEHAIEKHFPDTARETSGVDRASSFKVKKSTGLASWFVHNDEYAKRNLGVSSDIEHLEDILRLQRQLLQKIELLSLEAKRMIELQKVSLGDKEVTPSLGSTESQLKRLEKLVTSSLKDQKIRGRAKGKRNWRAVNTANYARRIWAILHWNEEMSENADAGSKDAYDDHLANFAPRSDKQDAPGPFGRFLKDINLALGILGADGEPVSAQTALKSLSTLEQLPQKSK